MSKLGEDLVRLRKRLGWTQERVAHEAGISRRYLHNLETGQVSKPSMLTMMSLANALKIHLDYFRLGIREAANANQS